MVDSVERLLGTVPVFGTLIKAGHTGLQRGFRYGISPWPGEIQLTTYFPMILRCALHDFGGDFNAYLVVGRRYFYFQFLLLARRLSYLCH